MASEEIKLPTVTVIEKKQKQEEKKGADNWVLRQPFDDEAQLNVAILAWTGLHGTYEEAKCALDHIFRVAIVQPNEIMPAKEVVDVEAQAAAWERIYNTSPPFHGLSTVKNIVWALLCNQPAFQGFKDMHPGNSKRLSKSRVYKKGSSFHSHTMQRLGVLSNKERWSELCMWINGNSSTYRKTTIQLLLSRTFVCAGAVMSPNKPCAHGVQVLDNADGKRDLRQFEMDHLIGFIHMPKVYSLIQGEIKAATRDRKGMVQLEKQLRSFMRHLVLGTTSHGRKHWPPAVYCRCLKCNNQGEKASGGVSHPSVWTPPEDDVSE